MAARVGLVDIVRDFVVVHQRFEQLFSEFRAGTLEFETVRHLVADSDSSVLFRLKERVHRKFRNRSPDLALRRGEVLFDLAVGSLFHEALKFRENLYQLKVYGPKIRSLRAEREEDVDGLLAEFEKLLRASSDRLGESLRETEILLNQTRRQLPALLLDFARDGSDESAAEIGFVTRFLLDEREVVEDVYDEGVEVLLRKVHGDLTSAYAAAIRSHLQSARFEPALALIEEARGHVAELPDAVEALEAYALGMQAFLEDDFGRSIEQLHRWNGTPDRGGLPVELARSALQSLPDLVPEDAPETLAAAARELASALGG